MRNMDMVTTKEDGRLGYYADIGYSIVENDHDSITILFNGIVIAMFNQPNIPPREIQEVCRRHKQGIMVPNIRA